MTNLPHDIFSFDVNGEVYQAHIYYDVNGELWRVHIWATRAWWWSAGLVIERLPVQVPAEAAGECSFCRANFLCRLLFGVRSTRVTAVARKRSRSFCQKYRWEVTPKHAYIQVGKGWLCCPGTVWELIRETSSDTTRQGTPSHNRLSSLNHCGLILALNKSEISMREVVSI